MVGSAKEQSERAVSPGLLLSGAIGFYETARAAHDHPPDHGLIPWPAIFVSACFAIELGLKSLIVALDGATEDDLRKRYGHNLRKALDRCLELGLRPPSKSASDALNLLSEKHRTMELRYLTGGGFWFDLEATLGAVEGLLTEVRSTLPPACLITE